MKLFGPRCPVLFFINAMVFTTSQLMAMEPFRFTQVLDIALASDSNLTGAQQKPNILSDRFMSLEARLNMPTELAFNKAFFWELAANHRAYEQTQQLNRSELSAAIIYRWQDRFSYRAPWYQVLLNGQWWDVAAKQRNSYVVTLQAMANARLTTKISWLLGWEYKQRDSDASVFDTEQSRLFFNIDYRLRGGPTFYGGGAYIDGHSLTTVQSVLCNGQQVTADYDFNVSSDAVALDQAFSEDYCGLWISFRLPSDTYSATLGVNYPLSHNTAVDLAWLYVDVSAQGIQYQRQIIQMNFIKTF